MPVERSETEVPKELLEQLEKARVMAAGDIVAPLDTKVKKVKLRQDEAERLRKKLESL